MIGHSRDRFLSGGEAGSGGSEDHRPAGAEEREVGEVEVAGRLCRLLLVDGLIPTHRSSSGNKGVRLTYIEGEIVHFDFAGHRYALVVDGVHRGGPASGDGEGPDRQADIRSLLTSRELQVVQLVCMGYLTKQVADRLRISEFTVRSYLKAVYAKLGVRSRAAMVCRYMEACQVGAGKSE